MLDMYPIEYVKQQPERDEDLGTKKKFWYISEKTGTNWLFKYPREESGEHWAEKIAAEVAASLGVIHAKVDLAVYEGTKGSVSESFTRRNRMLVHGNQSLHRAIQGYDVDLKYGQDRHTLSNIWKALDQEFQNQIACEIAKRHFASYLMLDAVIGNVDRHHQNWGIQKDRSISQRLFLAPSFDHASSLCREHIDEWRERELALKENRVGRYSERGRGGVYWVEGSRHAPSPLQLVRLAAPAYPEYFRQALRRLHNLDEGLLDNAVHRVPDDWMSDAAKKFAIKLMRYNLSELRKIEI